MRRGGGGGGAASEGIVLSPVVAPARPGEGLVGRTAGLGAVNELSSLRRDRRRPRGDAGEVFSADVNVDIDVGTGEAAEAEALELLLWL